MLDVKAEFTRFCGPSALYSSHTKEPRTLTLVYTIPAIGTDTHRVVAHLRNGLSVVLMRAVRQCAASAANHAYAATGHREADMQQLLKGRLV